MPKLENIDFQPNLSSVEKIVDYFMEADDKCPKSILANSASSLIGSASPYFSVRNELAIE